MMEVILIEDLIIINLRKIRKKFTLSLQVQKVSHINVFSSVNIENCNEKQYSVVKEEYFCITKVN